MQFERFFARDVDADELRALERALEGLPIVERGGGLDWRNGRPHARVGGLHCERIFGPLQRDACRCGKFVGESQRGVVCDRCHVEVGDPSLRTTRWACVVTRCGVVHPALHAAAERELGHPIDLDELEDLDQLDALEARTSRGLRVHRIPIAPPSRREYLVAPDDPSGRTRSPGPIDRMLQRLIAQLGQLDRFHGEPLVPAQLLVSMHASAARLLAAGVDARATIWGALEPMRRIVLCPRPPSRAARPVWRRPSRHLVRSMLWWGHDRLVLEGQPGLRILTIASHEVQEIEAGPCRLLGLVDEVLVVLGEHDVDEPAEIPGLAAYDLRTVSWLSELPAIPLALFEQDQPEDAGLLDAASGRVAAIENDSDRPGYLTHTPDLAYVWISDDNHEYGRVHACRSGEVALDLGMLPGCDDDVDERGAVGLVRAGERWRVLLDDGRVFEIDRQGPRLVWQLRRRPNAAAFSHDGERLALVRGGTITIHDADGRLLDVLGVPRSTVRR